MPPGYVREQGDLQVRDLLTPMEPQKGRSIPWRDIFNARDRRELLARLAHGDPLGLRPRLLRLGRERALLVHADRWLLRALALAAYHGMLYDGRPAVDTWCDGVVQRAVCELLREDLVGEHHGLPVASDDVVFYRLFGELLGIEPPLCRLASVRYHLVPRETRRILWRSALEGRSLEQLAEEHRMALEECAQRLRTTLDAIGNASPPTVGELTQRAEDLL